MTDPSENENKAPEESTDTAGGIPSKPTPDDKLVQDQMAEIEANADAAGDPEDSKTDPADASDDATVSDAIDDARPDDEADSEPDPALKDQDGKDTDGDTEVPTAEADQMQARDVDGLPQYQCHKTVEAFKIAEMEAMSNGYIRLISEDQAHSVVVDSAYVDKHRPQAGGYYVQYHDGYRSWSPADAFEQGYRLFGE